MTGSLDVAVVGAGILGLAHAYHLARRGLKVGVFERHPRARGASVRNFGMIWPVGQAPGAGAELARRSREIWLEVLRASGLWYAEAGSIHLAYHPDEEQVLQEFARSGAVPEARLLTSRETAERSPFVVREGLRAALWSPLELTVDPPGVIAGLPGWLAERYGVQFQWSTPVLAYNTPEVVTPAGRYRAGRLVVCTGTEYRALYPAAFHAEPLVPCKLQMLRTPALGETPRLGPMLAAGLTLLHYDAFAGCPSLPDAARRMERELPEHRRFGIRVMAAQNGAGEIVLGDSHEYGDAIPVFDNPEIDRLILEYLQGFVRIPGLAIAARWHGHYLKHPSAPYVAAHPAPGVMAVTGVGGAGMTLSFGLAQRLVAEWLGEEG